MPDPTRRWVLFGDGTRVHAAQVRADEAGVEWFHIGCLGARLRAERMTAVYETRPTDKAVCRRERCARLAKERP
jgi:hypothetical protein